MAEKGEENADPSKDDDELDALLDSALEDFDKLPSSRKDAPMPELSQKTGSDKKDSEVHTLNDMGLSESDIEAAAAEFEKSMKTMLGDDEELLKQWNEFAEKASFCSDGAKNGGCDPSPEDAEAFEAHLFKTMKDMTENAKEMTNSSGMDENLFKAMADMNVDRVPDFNNGIFPMMQGMMMNLLSKDVLYPALNELRIKYPPWLEEKKSALKSDVYENYLQQYKLVCEICSEYNKESKQDSEETKTRRVNRLMDLMQKMQKYGQPPQELVGDRHIPAAGMEGNIDDGFPPNKCPMM